MTLTQATYSMIHGAPINVMDYGAYGDGQHDDTAAIQAAINAAGSILTNGQPPSTYMNGGYPSPVVFLPPGAYRLTNSLTLYTGMTLMGQNDIAYTVESTRLIMDTATSDPIATGNEPGGVVNLNKNIINCSKTYTPTGTVLQPNICLTIVNIGFWIMNPNSTLANRGGSGWTTGGGGLGNGGTGCAIYFDSDVVDTRIKRCDFYSMPNAAIWHKGTSGDPIYVGYQIHECEFDTPIVSIRSDYAETDLVLNHNLFYSGSFQLYGYNCTGNVTCQTNHFGFQTRIKYFGDSTFKLNSFQFMSNRNDGSFSAGNAFTTIDISYTEQVHIVGNYFGSDNESCINVIGANGGTISNNTIVNSGFNQTVSNPTTDGGAIRLSGCQNVVVSGNSILTPATGTYGGFGIVSLDSTNPGRNIITNNTVSDKYNGSGYRGQPRRINVAAGDFIATNRYQYNASITPENRALITNTGKLYFGLQSTFAASGSANLDLTGMAFARIIVQASMASTTDADFFELLICRESFTGTYLIKDVNKNGVVASGNGPFAIAASNTITFSISTVNLVITVVVVSDSINIASQINGSSY
jgi:hypothetical protein